MTAIVAIVRRTAQMDLLDLLAVTMVVMCPMPMATVVVMGPMLMATTMILRVRPLEIAPVSQLLVVLTVVEAVMR